MPPLLVSASPVDPAGSPNLASGTASTAGGKDGSAGAGKLKGQSFDFLTILALATQTTPAAVARVPAPLPTASAVATPTVSGKEEGMDTFEAPKSAASPPESVGRYQRPRIVGNSKTGSHSASAGDSASSVDPAVLGMSILAPILPPSNATVAKKEGGEVIEMPKSAATPSPSAETPASVRPLLGKPATSAPVNVPSAPTGDGTVTATASAPKAASSASETPLTADAPESKVEPTSSPADDAPTEGPAVIRPPVVGKTPDDDRTPTPVPSSFDASIKATPADDDAPVPPVMVTTSRPTASKSTAAERPSPSALPATSVAPPRLLQDGHRFEGVASYPATGQAERRADETPPSATRQAPALTDAVAPAAVSLGDGAPDRTAPPVFAQVARGIVTQAELVAKPGSTDFHLQIEPPNLGTVTIHLTATEHTITARVVVQHEQTQVLLAGQANDLRQVLAQSGITLTGFDVSHRGGEAPGQREQPPGRPEPPAPPTKPKARGVTSRPAATDTIDLIA